MSDDVQRTLGAHDADIANLQKTVDKLAEDVAAIRSAVDQGTGGWKALMWIVSVSGAIGGALGWVASHIRPGGIP